MTTEIFEPKKSSFEKYILRKYHYESTLKKELSSKSNQILWTSHNISSA